MFKLLLLMTQLTQATNTMVTLSYFVHMTLNIYRLKQNYFSVEILCKLCEIIEKCNLVISKKKLMINTCTVYFNMQTHIKFSNLLPIHNNSVKCRFPSFRSSYKDS